MRCRFVAYTPSSGRRIGGQVPRSMWRTVGRMNTAPDEWLACSKFIISDAHGSGLLVHSTAGRSASMCRSGYRLRSEVAGEFAGDCIDECDSRKAAMFGDLQHRTVGLGADSRECLARLRGAAQLRLCELGQMFEVLLAQIRAPAIGHCG